MSYQLITGEWTGCYESGWKGLIVDEAFSHPAKIAHGLAFRIYDHAIKEGWLRPGDTVCDPFGGIGGTALHAATSGIHWIGVELEERFVYLGNRNIDLWKREFGHWPEWVTPTLLKGDSRRLGELVGAVGCVVSSPPYATGDSASAQSIMNRSDKSAAWVKDNCGSAATQGYGTSPGQLGSMRDGSVDSVISSPPYAESLQGDGSAKETAAESRAKRVTQGGSLGQSCRARGYGGVENLGNLKEGDVDAVVSSPPYETGGHHDHQMDSWNANGRGHGVSKDECGYGTNPAQLGGDTFWTAASQIVSECHRLLRPGGHVIWVVKDYVKAKKIVPFCDNWRRLCESVGFRTVCIHRAMLVKDLGEETNLFEAPKRRTKERKSFFRRLAEKKGSPRIDYECVICMVK